MLRSIVPSREALLETRTKLVNHVRGWLRTQLWKLRGRGTSTLPARLRMNVIGKPGVDKADFELWCLAVSAINGCGVCIDSHEKILREAGLSAEQIQAAIRIAAVVHAVAVTLDGEAHSAGAAIGAAA